MKKNRINLIRLFFFLVHVLFELVAVWTWSGSQPMKKLEGLKDKASFSEPLKAVHVRLWIQMLGKVITFPPEVAALF